jgi:hypothetical protein
MWDGLKIDSYWTIIKCYQQWQKARDAILLAAMNLTLEGRAPLLPLNSKKHNKNKNTML